MTFAELMGHGSLDDEALHAAQRCGHAPDIFLGAVRTSCTVRSRSRTVPITASASSATRAPGLTWAPAS
jgi:hypothetical protein